MSGQGEERPRPAPAPGGTRGSFRVGFLGAGIPIIALSLLSVAGNIDGYAALLVYLWFFGALAWLGALLAMIVAYVAGQPETGTGILAALAVGLLVLGATCFA
ncbi:MAG TPA: hypothetical protein VFW96_29145, partial [Thermomicrobiales bacterium]|nr:hypothetical protein [Thermomicrobiales bacterium]